MRSLGLLAVSLFLAPAAALAAEELALKGEVVEVSCYSKMGVVKGTGTAHASCAVKCAKEGKPLGILTDGDGLFKFVGEYTDNNNAKLIPFVGKQVEVRGTRDRYTDYTIAIRPSRITLAK